MVHSVLYLDHSGDLGGAELYLLDLLKHSNGESEVVVFQHGSFPDRLQKEGLPHTVIETSSTFLGVHREGGMLSALASIPSVARLACHVADRLMPHDLIYANSQKALIVGGLASRIARKPLIWNLHDILTSQHFGALNQKIAVLWSNLFVSHVITNSNATLDAYRAAGGRAPASVIYNGISPEVFDEVRRSDVEKVKQELELGEGPVVGIFSRLAQWKGQHVLLEALQKAPEWKTLVVGGALFQEDKSYAQELRDYVERYDFQDRVHFLGFRDDVPLLMQAVDVVAHTSVAPEPFGRVVVEGMLAGKPVIATACGGPVEIIEHEKTGLLVEPGNSAELAQTLSLVADNPAKSMRLARRGVKHARSQFSLQRMCNSIQSVVKRVICEAQ